MEHQWDQGEGEEGLDGEEAEGDGEEHHGSPSVQPGGHQDLGAPPGHQAAWTLSLQQTQPGIWLTDCNTFSQAVGHLRWELRGWSSPCLCRFPHTDSMAPTTGERGLKGSRTPLKKMSGDSTWWR